MHTKYSTDNIKPGDRIKIRRINNQAEWVDVVCFVNRPNTGLTGIRCTNEYKEWFEVGFDRIETTESEVLEEETETTTDKIKKLIQARIDTFEAILANPKTIKAKRAKSDSARVALKLVLRDIDFIESEVQK